MLTLCVTLCSLCPFNSILTDCKHELSNYETPDLLKATSLDTTVMKVHDAKFTVCCNFLFFEVLTWNSGRQNTISLIYQENKGFQMRAITIVSSN